MRRRSRDGGAKRLRNAGTTTRATGEQGIDGLKQFGSKARGQASSVKGKLSDRIAKRKLRRSEGDE